MKVKRPCIEARQNDVLNYQAISKVCKDCHERLLHSFRNFDPSHAGRAFLGICMLNNGDLPFLLKNISPNFSQIHFGHVGFT